MLKKTCSDVVRMARTSFCGVRTEQPPEQLIVKSLRTQAFGTEQRTRTTPSFSAFVRPPFSKKGDDEQRAEPRALNGAGRCTP